MRYAAISAVVFASAFFMAPGSSATAQTSNNLLKIHSSTTAQKIDLSPLSLLPRVNFATAKAAQPIKPAAAPAAQPVAPVEEIATVSPGDNLSVIAAAHQESAQRLYDANTWLGNPNLLEPGQVVRIPADDEQLASRPMPEPVAAAIVRASAPVSESAAPAAAGGSVWDSLASCESGGNWAINTGNGFYGGLQFTLATWQGLGGSGLPSQASRDEQIARATALQARSGWGQWPACSAKLGLL